MIEERDEFPVNFAARGILCILDLFAPNNKLNPKAAHTKWVLRKKILDGLNQIENENSIKEE